MLLLVDAAFVNRTFTQGVSGTSMFTGSLLKHANIPFTGTLSSSAIFITISIFKAAFTAILSFAGLTNKLTSTSLVASYSFIGKFSKMATIPLIANISFSSIFGPGTFPIMLSATLGFTSGYSFLPFKVFHAALSLSGKIIRGDAQDFYADLSLGSMGFGSDFNAKGSFFGSSIMKGISRYSIVAAIGEQVLAALNRI